MVEEWNSDSGTVVHVMVEQCILWWNSGTSDDGTVDYLTVEQWNMRWSKSTTFDGGTLENLMVEQCNRC